MEWDKKKKVILVIVVLIVLFALGYLFYVGGTRGVSNMLDTLMVLSIWGMIIGVIGGVVYFLFFFEKKINATLEVFKAIKTESTISRLPNLRNLYLSGDEDYSRPILIGKIVGFSNRKNYSMSGEKFSDETILVVKKASRGIIDAMIKMFSGSIIIRCPSNLHTTLHGDVTIKTRSLVKHSMYFYPSVTHLDIKAIDETLYKEGERFVQLNFISKIEPIISRAVGVTKEDMKLLEGKTGYEMVADKTNQVVGGNKNG